MDYIDNVKTLRKRSGKTQADMAALLETTQQQYSKYENRANELPVRHLITICKYFHVRADELLGLED